MRRALATGFALVVVGVLGACGGDDENGGQAADNTAQVCDDAEQVQAEQSQQLDDDLAQLQQDESLDEEQFQEEAVTVAQGALTNWSDGLREQAGRATNSELAGALTDLADGLASSADELTFENMATGEIPGAERLDEIGWTLTEICDGTTSPPPGN